MLLRNATPTPTRGRIWWCTLSTLAWSVGIAWGAKLVCRVARRILWRLLEGRVSRARVQEDSKVIEVFQRWH